MSLVCSRLHRAARYDFLLEYNSADPPSSLPLSFCSFTRTASKPSGPINMASQNLANLALDGGDPRLGEKNPGQFALDHGHEAELANGFSIEAAQVHNDPSILFEEYLHYAKITRAEEREYEGNLIKRKDPWSLGGIIKNRFSKGHVHEINAVVGEDAITTTHGDFSTVTDLEWRKASRATRTAAWGSVFFLITTDILGPSGAP